MCRLSLIAAFTVALSWAVMPMSAKAADPNADKIYKYPPYGQQSQSGNDTQVPDSNPGPPPTARGYEQDGYGQEGYDQGRRATGPRDDEPAYRDDARSAPDGYDNDGDEGADVSPPRQAEGPPSRSGPLPLIEATASAPDRSIPYDVRKHDARRAAVDAWRSKVAGRFGPEFSRWRMAAHKRVDCLPERGDVICTVSGVPVRGYGRVGRSYRDDRY